MPHISCCIVFAKHGPMCAADIRTILRLFEWLLTVWLWVPRRPLIYSLSASVCVESESHLEWGRGWGALIVGVLKCNNFWCEFKKDVNLIIWGKTKWFQFNLWICWKQGLSVHLVRVDIDDRIITRLASLVIRTIQPGKDKEWQRMRKWMSDF